MEQNTAMPERRTVTIRELKHLREKAYRNAETANPQLGIMLAVDEYAGEQSLNTTNNLSITINKKDA